MLKFDFLSSCLTRFMSIAFSQEDKGVKKYGKMLDPKDSYDWIQMAEEEMVDGWKYIQCARDSRELDKAALRAAGQRIRELELYQKEYQCIMHVLDTQVSPEVVDFIKICYKKRMEESA